MRVIYHVAVYLRLSRDDAAFGQFAKISGGKIESNSIRSQRELVCSYIASHKDMELFDSYVDDGRTGANFDRPAFKRMMKDIEDGLVNCVIVKDLSRFGRDYIEAGRLIQKIFPALHVRFIAINDHFDSLTADFNEVSVVLPIKNFINDSYCRDISLKVKSHQQVKRQKGEFIGAFAVYGYQKSRENKHLLVVDPYAAKIVQKIFAWKLEGFSFLAIAEKLNTQGILSPMEYKRSKGVHFQTGFSVNSIAKWSAMAVKRILVNEVYTGSLVQGKREKVNYKMNKCIEKPEDEWVRVENTHAAIISKEDFENVKRLLCTDSRAVCGRKKAHIFSGLLFCGDCMEAMVRRVNKYKGKEKVYFICQQSNKGLGCSRHSIDEEHLKKLVLDSLRLQAEIMLDKVNVIAQVRAQEVDFDELMTFERELLQLKSEQEQYISLQSGLYEDWKKGIITKEDFLDFKKIYEEKFVHLQKMIEQQDKTIKERFRAKVALGIQLERFKEVLEFTELNREILITFVQRIFVYEDKRICIEFRFQELFERAVISAAKNEKGRRLS